VSQAWPEVPIGSISTAAERWGTPTPGVEYRQIGVRLWGGGAYERDPLDGGDTKYGSLNRVQAGDIIVNKIWARNGSVSVVPQQLAGCYCSGEFPLFKPIVGKLDQRWFYWITKTNWFWRRCDAQSQGTSGKNRIRPERFLEIPIPLPPLADQRRIVAKVEELAAKIDEARRLRERATDENTSLEKASVDQVYHKQLTECGPTTLADVCTSLTDGDHVTPSFSEEGVPFIFVGNVSTGKLHFRSCKFVAEDYFRQLAPLRKPSRGDVLYSAVGATLGVPVVVDTDEDFCFQRHIAILKPDRTKVLPDYMRHMLRSATVFEKAWQSTTGTAQPTIPLRGIRALKIAIPPLPEQCRIVAYLDDLQTKVDCLKALQAQTQAELEALLPSILDKAFKGEL
jgi:type I restriction enzyme S subunit